MESSIEITQLKQFDQLAQFGGFIYRLKPLDLMLRQLSTIMSEECNEEKDHSMLKTRVAILAVCLLIWGDEFPQECQPMRRHLASFLYYHLAKLDWVYEDMEGEQLLCLKCADNYHTHTWFPGSLLAEIHRLPSNLLSEFHTTQSNWFYINMTVMELRKRLMVFPSQR
jgi:hypothetical protein